MSTDDTNAARRGSGSNDLLGPLLPEREGQPRTLTIAMPWEDDRGHWYSPAAVREMLAAERERWELHLSSTRKLAEANSKRGDDCGMLARTFLDTLKAMKA